MDILKYIIKNANWKEMSNKEILESLSLIYKLEEFKNSLFKKYKVDRDIVYPSPAKKKRKKTKSKKTKVLVR